MSIFFLSLTLALSISPSLLHVIIQSIDTHSCQSSSCCDLIRAHDSIDIWQIEIEDVAIDRSVTTFCCRSILNRNPMYVNPYQLVRAVKSAKARVYYAVFDLVNIFSFIPPKAVWKRFRSAQQKKPKTSK